MRRLIAIVVGLLLCFGSTVWATEGTATLTVEYLSVAHIDGIPRSAELKWVVTSDGTTGKVGSATACAVTTTATVDLQIVKIFKRARRIDRVIIIPAGGAAAPSAAYDIEVRVNTSISSDLLGGLGDNLVNTTTYMDAPDTETNTYPMYIRELPIMFGENIGNSNTYTVYLLLVTE
jgi:hypothetical protein